MPAEITRIAVVDDHTLFREGLVSLLTKSNYRFQVVWQASTGVEFLEKLKEEIPEVILMDISMPLMDGIEATVKATALYSCIRIIALSMYGERGIYLKMIQAGAKGFLAERFGHRRGRPNHPEGKTG